MTAACHLLAEAQAALAVKARSDCPFQIPSPSRTPMTSPKEDQAAQAHVLLIHLMP